MLAIGMFDLFIYRSASVVIIEGIGCLDKTERIFEENNSDSHNIFFENMVLLFVFVLVC
jgi:hypothetical protein